MKNDVLPLFAAAPPDRVVVIRSPRRRRTISAQRRNGVIEIRLPTGMSFDEEQMWIERMARRLDRRRSRAGDDDLARRARRLSDRYFGGALVPASIRWSDNMSTRWGSCTIDTGTVRLSSRMREFPGWVVDYVIVHEVAHLRYRSHGPRFWSLVNRYPLTERARGYLIAKGGEPD
jgi:predicted metal-dependent hydrolase